MAPVYGGVRTGLQPGDIAGIQAIYGARTPDSYQSQGMGVGLSAPIDLSASLAASSQVVVSTVSLAAIGDVEYYSFVAPSDSGGVLQITAAAANISMLSPRVSLYDASGTLLAQADNPNAWSDNVTASLPAVVPGQRYYIAVAGDTHDYFDVGAYQLIVSLPQISQPTPPAPPVVVTPPPTPPAPPIVLPRPVATNTSPQTATRLGSIVQTTLPGLGFNANPTALYYYFQTGWTGAYKVSAAGVLIQAFTARGRFIAQGDNQVSLPSARVGTAYYVKILPVGNAVATSFNLSIGRQTPIAAVHKTAKPRHLDADYTFKHPGQTQRLAGISQGGSRVHATRAASVTVSSMRTSAVGVEGISRLGTPWIPSHLAALWHRIRCSLAGKMARSARGA
jgi:hypothetical protein